MDDQQQITVPENTALSFALRALKIPHTIYDEQGNSVMTITLDSQSDYDLLQLWRALTTVQYQYTAQVQQHQPIQLSFPIPLSGEHPHREAPHA